MVIDLSLDQIKNTRFHNKYHILIRNLAKETYMTETEVTCFLLIYYKFELSNGKKMGFMTHNQLAVILQVHYNINDRLVIENIVRTCSKDVKIIITPTAWINLIAIFANKSLEDQIRFCFKVYDIYERGFLERFVINAFIQNFFIGNDEESEDNTKDVLELLIKRFDVDKDGIISFNDYRTTVLKTPSLLQFLGICIPTIFGPLGTMKNQ